MIQNILTKVHPNNFNTTKSINTSQSSLLKSAICDSISFKSTTLDKDIVSQDAMQCLFEKIKKNKGILTIDMGYYDRCSFSIDNFSTESTLPTSNITFKIMDAVQRIVGIGQLVQEKNTSDYKIMSYPSPYHANMLDNIINSFTTLTGINKEAIVNSYSPVEYMASELVKLTNLDDQKVKKANKLVTTYMNQNNRFKNEQNNSSKTVRQILESFTKKAEKYAPMSSLMG